MLNMNPCSHIAISILNKKNKRVLSRSAPACKGGDKRAGGGPGPYKRKKILAGFLTIFIFLA
jgi:hypothetical protein